MDAATEQLIALMRERFSFPIVRESLRRQELPVGQGWASTIEKLDPLVSERSTRAETLRALGEIRRDLSLFGEKAIRLYVVDESELRPLLHAIDSVMVPSSIAADAYPLLIAERDLANEAQRPKIVRVENDDEGNAHLIFAGKRYETKRETLVVEELPESARAELDEYDEVIAVRRTPFQFFDVITMHPDSLIVEVRIDAPSKLTAGELEQRFRAVKRAFNALVDPTVGEPRMLHTFKNIFPAVAALYRQRNGRVRKAVAATSSASIKDERMRSRYDDLREESFHRTGKASVTYSPYAITKTWNSKSGDGYIELELPGSLGNAGAQHPILKTALVRGGTREDFTFAVSQLI